MQISIDESCLYGDDHHERCVECVGRFFRETRPPCVRAVYAMGSVVTGDYHPGHSDLDIVIITEDSDAANLLEALRILNQKLWIVTFHLHKPADFPPLDHYFTVRLLAEHRLLYGQEALGAIPPMPDSELRSQLLASLSLRAVMLRSLGCSRLFEKYEPDHAAYYCHKIILFALRALLMIQGDRNTSRRHVIEQFRSRQELLTERNREFFLDLEARIQNRNYPGTIQERLLVLHHSVALLEEIQTRISR